jgi:hypothetical protein
MPFSPALVRGMKHTRTSRYDGSCSHKSRIALVATVLTVATVVIADLKAKPSTPPSLGAGASERKDARISDSQEATNDCVECHKKGRDGVADLFARSTHAKAGKTCNSCHGGDSTVADKKKAHGAGFVGRPSSADSLRMCGQCHRQQLVTFKSGRHLSASGVPRIDCVGCHGAHTVGDLSRTFLNTCAGCHGLEYLPDLPAELHEILAASEDLRSSLAAAAGSGGSVSEEVLKGRKELSRLIAEVVHSTDRKRAAEQRQQILSRVQELKGSIH